MHRTVLMTGVWLLFLVGVRLLGAGGNVLLLVVDDLGADGLAMLNPDSAARQPPTPNLDALRSQGVLFRRCYSHPTCSPSRASMLTGRYPFRHGIGYAIASPSDPQLKPGELTIPKVLASVDRVGGHAHAHLGKWHLSYGNDDPRTVAGWSHFAGSIAGAIPNYDRWPKVVDGVLTAGYSVYATTDLVDDALHWIQGQGTNRWVLWVAFNAGHTPLHKPPSELHSYDGLPDSAVVAQANPRPYFESMIQALDTELGRLLTVVDLTVTTVIVVGDNGSTGAVIQPPYSPSRAKGTLYEGGIRVPLLVAGAEVRSAGRASDAVVHLTDLYATILELVGMAPSQWQPEGNRVDARSLVPIVHDEAFAPLLGGVLSENFSASIPDDVAGRTAIDARYKLIQFRTGLLELYDLAADPQEKTNLLAAGSLPADAGIALARLKGWLATWAEPPVVRTTLVGVDRLELGAEEAMGQTLRLEQAPEPGGPWTDAVTTATARAGGRVTWTVGGGGGSTLFRVVTSVP